MLRRSCYAVLAMLALGWAFLPSLARAQSTQTIEVNPDTVLDGFANDPQGAIRAARMLIAQGHMHRAIASLEAYVNAHPGNLDPRRFLGDLYFRTGQLSRAQFTYQEILKFNDGDKETHNRLGTVYAVENRIDDAIKQFNAALPGTDSVTDLVALHERKGDLSAYQAQMDRLAQDYPSDPGIQGELGQIYNAIHQPYEASVYFHRALDSDSQNLTALNGLGLAYLNMHDYADAEAQFKTCVRIDPAAYPCVDDLGATYLEAKQYDLAQKTLVRAQELAPERAETYVNFGYLADARGDWQRAAAYYAQAIGIDPYVRESYIDLALAYEDHKLYPLAQAALLKGLAAVTDDGRLHVLLGNAYEAQGEKAKAIEQYRLALAGTDPDALRIARESLPASSATPH